MILMSDFFDFNRGLYCMATFRSCCQDLVKSLLSTRLLFANFFILRKGCIMGLHLCIDLILENLLHSASKRSFFNEIIHAGLTIGLPYLQLLM